MNKTINDERRAIRSRGPDECVGITINQLLFTTRTSRRQLGDALGISGPSVGRKVRGEIGWSLDDLYKAADFFDVDITDLLPQKVPAQQETPDFQSEAEGSRKVVAGAGFEPTTSGL
ncbi:MULTISPECIES: helix-turn-helix domain-containing protein [Corynebacterium]|uniref:helix-turn-helix domain-containing protein n=1 Tax=Corynebacterium TaxID=1716 RepID=UPI00124D6190|nr:MULTISPECIES: helix-turn-helix transcriptional regulator [Corynebacterium]